MFILNGKPVSDNGFTAPVLVDGEIDAVQFPPGWIASASVKEREAVGIIEVPNPVRPDDRFFFVTGNPDGTYTATPKPLAILKDLKRKEIKDARRAAENAGTELNGIKLATDEASQTKYNGAALAAVLDPQYSVNWKAEDGFVTLSAPQLLGVAQAVRAYIQAQFDKEADLLVLVDAAETSDDLKEIRW
jgi:hypothetical protein